MNTPEIETATTVYTINEELLDFRSMRSLAKEIRQLAEESKTFTLDLSHVYSLDSHVLLFFLSLNSEMKSRNGTLYLRHPSTYIQKVLSLTHADTVLHIS